jgi:hypothetical protein
MNLNAFEPAFKTTVHRGSPVRIAAHLPLIRCLIQWTQPRVFLHEGRPDPAWLNGAAQAVAELSPETRCYVWSQTLLNEFNDSKGPLLDELQERIRTDFGVDFNFESPPPICASVDLITVRIRDSGEVDPFLADYFDIFSPHAVIVLLDDRNNFSSELIDAIVSGGYQKAKCLHFDHRGGITIVRLGEPAEADSLSDLFLAEESEQNSAKHLFAELGDHTLSRAALIQCESELDSANRKIEEMGDDLALCSLRLKNLMESPYWRFFRPVRRFQRWVMYPPSSLPKLPPDR